MANVHLPPVITDVRGCVYFAGHSEEFFKAMDALKPYVLISVSSDCAVVRLCADEIDLTKLRNTLKRLNDLGYYAETAFHWKMFIGEVITEMENLRISWKNDMIWTARAGQTAVMKERKNENRQTCEIQNKPGRIRQVS